MANQLVIKGGTVHDGTGAPAPGPTSPSPTGASRRSGPNLDGDRVLDAGGCVVAPGFIDIHTHYDAQVFWDPALTPSCYHGVTTVVAGNCGFSIAPTRRRAPRAHRPHAARTSRTWTSQRWRPASRGTSRPSPSTWRRCEPRRRHQLRRLHRSHRVASLRDGRRRLRAHRHRRGDRGDAAGAARGDGRGRRRLRHELRVRRTAASTASRCPAGSPTGPSSRRCSRRWARSVGAWCRSRPASSAGRPTWSTCR